MYLCHQLSQKKSGVLFESLSPTFLSWGKLGVSSISLGFSMVFSGEGCCRPSWGWVSASHVVYVSRIYKTSGDVRDFFFLIFVAQLFRCLGGPAGGAVHKGVDLESCFVATCEGQGILDSALLQDFCRLFYVLSSQTLRPPVLVARLRRWVVPNVQRKRSQ